MGIGPVASNQLPLTRSKASGQPWSQRALKRRVAVWPEASELLAKAISQEFAPVQMRSLQRMCSEWLLW